jgi:osomolarity two-component system, response regulator SKN7
MNGLLPKPFTKDGLLRTLDRFLAHFKKDYQPPQQSSDSYASLGLNAQQTSTAHSFKDEPSPGKSSSTSSWHSPTQMTNSSPAGTASQNAFLQQMHQGSGQYTIASAHPHGYQSQSQSQSPVAAMNAQVSGSMGGPRTDQGQGPARSGVSGSQRRTLNEMAPNVEEQKPEKKQRMYPPQSSFS